MTLINILLSMTLFSTIFDLHNMLKLLQRTQIHLTLNYSITPNTIVSFIFMSNKKLVNFTITF